MCAMAFVDSYTIANKQEADPSTHHPQAEEYAWGPVHLG